jgi:hypothetical protein
MNLKGRQDKWRLLLPEDVIPNEIKEKYAKVLKCQHSFTYKPIDLLNESIQKIQVLGFSGGTIEQPQSMLGEPLRTPSRIAENDMMHTSNAIPYRSPDGPVSLVDKTLNVDFRHQAGFLNYFLLFESFFYQYSRDTESDALPTVFPIDIYNEDGEVYCRIMLYNPLIDSMDMLDLDFTQTVAQSQTFRVVFKYSNIDFQFIEDDAVSEMDVDNPETKADYVSSSGKVAPDGLEETIPNNN